MFWERSSLPSWHKERMDSCFWESRQSQSLFSKAARAAGLWKKSWALCVPTTRDPLYFLSLLAEVSTNSAVRPPLRRSQASSRIIWVGVVRFPE